MTFPGAPLWRTAYERDLTTLSNQDLKSGGDGNKTIDGLTWLLGNSANAASINVVNGTGIVFVASAAVTGFYEGGATRNAPNLTIPVPSVFPLYDIVQNAIRVIVRIVLSGADTNVEGGKLFLEYVSTPVNQNVSIAKTFAGGLGFQTNEAHSPTFTTPYPFNTSSPTDDLLGLVFSANKAWQAYSGLYVAGDKLRLARQRGSFFQDLGTPPIRVASDVRLGFCQVTNNATASLTTTFTHLRVDFSDQLPAL